MSPFESAWLLLKEFYIKHPDSDAGGFHQREIHGENKLIQSLDRGTPKGYPGHYKNRFHNRNDPSRRKAGFTKVLTDGKTRYADNVYDESTDSMVEPYDRPQQSPDEFRLGSSVPRRQPRNESERQPGATQTGAFTGVGLDSRYDGSDESTQRIADIMGHEFTHGAIEDEIEDFTTSKYGSSDEVKPIRESTGEPDFWESILPTGKITNLAEIVADAERLANRNELRTYAHEYGAHQADESSQAGVNAQLARRRDTKDLYNQFNLFPLQPQAMSMLPPTPGMEENMQPVQPVQPEQPTQ